MPSTETDWIDRVGTGFYALIRPTPILVAIFAFFVLFPEFMDLIVPDNPGGYAGGTINPEGEVVSRYEGGTAPQYQWWYPIVLPFMIVWYLAIVGFDLIEVVLGLPDGWYPVASNVYLYLLSAVLAPGVEKAWSASASVRGRLRSAIAEIG